MKLSRITRLYISNFLSGLVFWYSIEILFMFSIGIDAVGIGLAAGLMMTFNLIFDIPAGILADKWSRKGLLVVSAVALGASSAICGLSNSLALYLVGYVVYGVYVVCTSGTYQAIIYDILHEEGRADQYSKVMGRAYAFFLVAGINGVISGFLAARYGYRFVFFLSVIPCMLNFFLLLSIKEPRFHKNTQTQNMLRQIGAATKTMAGTKTLRALAIVWSVFAVVEVFKSELGQMYLLRYVSGPELMGLLWAAYSFTWALGSFIAHRFRARLNTLIILSVLPLILMSFVDNAWSILLFMLQAVASGAMTNQIETRVQENTPSAVRASVMSVLSSMGRALAIPGSFAIGWITRGYNSLWALRFVATLATLTLIYWLFTSKKTSSGNQPIIGEETAETEEMMILGIKK